MDETRPDLNTEPQEYEPPLVEDLPTEDGPAIAAAGAAGDQGDEDVSAGGPEWRP
jgi:hypothetical protein